MPRAGAGNKILRGPRDFGGDESIENARVAAKSIRVPNNMLHSDSGERLRTDFLEIQESTVALIP